jgi:hypothetical protein
LIYLKSNEALTFGKNIDSHSRVSLGVVCIHDVKSNLRLAQTMRHDLNCLVGAGGPR